MTPRSHPRSLFAWSAVAIASSMLVHAAPTPALPAYETETWPSARRLTWATPGQSGAYGDPANWIEDGRPASMAPNRESDVVLPGAPTPYSVSSKPEEEVRHLIVERNARIAGVHRNDLQVWGNVWVKDGGWIQFLAMRGPKHTYLRLEGAEFPDAKNGITFLGGMGKAPTTLPQSRARISHKLEIAKYGDASVEFIGNIGVGDEIMVQHGRLIVSGDLRWSGVTDKGALEVFDGGILELQSGASIAPFENTNAKSVYNINLYRNAVLRAGSPERPLTADAHVRLGFGPNLKPGDSGLYAAAGSRIEVFSADPSKAKLVFTSITGSPGFHDGKGRLLADPTRAASGSDGIVLRLAGEVRFEGVRFDYVSAEGIRLGDPASRERWTHVDFGPHNAAPPAGLFARLDVDANTYYHNRGDGQSEFALTTRATRSMADYMRKTDVYQIAVSPAPVKTGSDGARFEKPLSIVFAAPIEVEISTKLPVARIHYTIDGSEPGETSPRYTGPLRLDRTTRLIIRAFADGQKPSPVFTAAYVFGN